MLRHTKFIEDYTCARLFPLGDDATAAEKKWSWANKLRQSLTVIDNPPLTTLLHEFKRAVYHSLKEPEVGDPVPLTYEAVLQIFDRAIARDDWPLDDKAIPFTPIGPVKTNTVFRGPLQVASQARQAASKGSKKRPREHDDKEIESGVALGTQSGTASATLCPDTSTGARRSKRARSAVMPPPSTRVTRSQSRRSGQA